MIEPATLRAGTWADSCRFDYPQDEEWVHVALIDQLLVAGVDPSEIRYEYWLSSHSRPDVVVVFPDMVLVFECKREERLAQSTARQQVRRYLDAGRRRFRPLPVYGYLVWAAAGAPDALSFEAVW